MSVRDLVAFLRGRRSDVRMLPTFSTAILFAGYGTKRADASTPVRERELASGGHR